MRTVTVPVKDLLEKLYLNRTAHRELYEKAEKGYRATVIEELDKHLANARRGKPIEHFIRFDPPDDHTRDYDVAIQMLEMHVNPTIEITNSEFDCYVRNNWPWFEETLVKNTSYSQKV